MIIKVAYGSIGEELVGNACINQEDTLVPGLHIELIDYENINFIKNSSDHGSQHW